MGIFLQTPTYGLLDLANYTATVGECIRAFKVHGKDRRSLVDKNSLPTLNVGNGQVWLTGLVEQKAIDPIAPSYRLWPACVIYRRDKLGGSVREMRDSATDCGHFLVSNCPAGVPSKKKHPGRKAPGA